VTNLKEHSIHPRSSAASRTIGRPHPARKADCPTRRTALAKSAALAGVGALAASLSACGGAHTAIANTAATAKTAASTPAAATPTATGPTLRAVLPTAADLAAGVTASGTIDTGTAWTAPGALPAPSLPGADCTAAPSIDADAATSDYRAAYASEYLENSGNSLELIVAATNPGDAAKQLAELRAFAAHCQGFTAPDGTETTVALDTFAGLGDEAIRIRVTAAPGANAAGSAEAEVILVRVGDEIAAVSDTDPAQDEAAAVSAATFLTARLTGRSA
jgi:hypothetical protein